MRTPVLLACLAATSLSTAVAAAPMDPPDETDDVPWLLIAPTPRDNEKNDDQDKAKEAPQDDEPVRSKNAPWVEITIEGDRRRIRSNGLPNHETGRFPNRGNPHSISAQEYDFRIPVTPTDAARPVPVGMNMFGVALNGCFFEAGTAEWWKNDRTSGWHIEAIGPRGGHLGLDFTNGHVQRTGAYHYHAVPDGLLGAMTAERSEERLTLIGWAADGHPIYGPFGHVDPMDLESPVKRLEPSWQLKPGQRPEEPEGPGGRHDGTYEEDFVFVESSGDLDALNGRFGITPEFPEGTYHYVVTDSFPFVSRSWKGTPSPDMSKRSGRPGEGRRGDGRRGEGRGRGGAAGDGRRPNGPPSRGPGRNGGPGRPPDRPTRPGATS